MREGIDQHGQRVDCHWDDIELGLYNMEWVINVVFSLLVGPTSCTFSLSVFLAEKTCLKRSNIVTKPLQVRFFYDNIWFQQTSYRFILIDWLMDWLLLNVQQAVFQPLVYWLREQDQQ
jgi:hypothetical protein